ncbi:hypothetical protein SRABI134_03867 [Peribacillus sp. Bi134]|nr:hypothetical protein SRABI134_03867 [Peribacillus sp. Bi134]
MRLIIDTNELIRPPGRLFDPERNLYGSRAKNRPVARPIRPKSAEIRPTEQKIRPMAAEIRPTEQKIRPTAAEIRPTERKNRPTTRSIRPSQYHAYKSPCSKQ